MLTLRIEEEILLPLWIFAEVGEVGPNSNCYKHVNLVSMVFIMIAKFPTMYTFVTPLFQWLGQIHSKNLHHHEIQN